MGYFARVTFYMLMIAFTINILNALNLCYLYGSALAACPNEAGTGHAFIPVQYQTWLDYTFRDAKNNVVDVTNQASWNQTMNVATEYQAAPQGLNDIFGFFTWVINGGKLIVNTLLSPVYGFPQFIVTYFWVPQFLMNYVAATLGIIQIFGLYEFFTGRDIFR